MYDIDYTRRLLNRTLELTNIMNELYEEEDEYLASWLVYGIPDGSSIDEIVAILDEDEQNFNNYYYLAVRLLKARHNEDF